MKTKIQNNSINMEAQPRPKFPLGRVLITSQAYEQLPLGDQLAALGRHQYGDWGEICEEDREENELSFREGYRLLSVYQSHTGKAFYIITEHDRSATTILLPCEY